MRELIAAGPGNGCQPQRARGRGHQIDEAGASKRRHRILALTRPLEDVAAAIDRALDVAGLSRDAELVLDLVVVRLQFVETERPVLDRRARRQPRRAVALRRFADDLEVPRVEPPALRPVVQRRAADGVHHRVARRARRRRRRVDAMRGHFAVALLNGLRPVADVVADLVRREVAARQPGAGLEPDDIDACGRRSGAWRRRRRRRGR